MTSEDLLAEALHKIELAKVTVNTSRRRAIMDHAFAMVREAKRLREKEPRGPREDCSPQYRAWFYGDQGYLYFDLPVSVVADAIWAAEALAAALAEDYDRFALWDGQRQLFNSSTGLAVFCSDAAVKVNRAVQQIVLDAEELALKNHKALAGSRHLLEATAALRRILTEPTKKAS